jgi:hypothetical protein
MLSHTLTQVEGAFDLLLINFQLVNIISFSASYWDCISTVHAPQKRKRPEEGLCMSANHFGQFEYERVCSIHTRVGLFPTHKMPMIRTNHLDNQDLTL